MSETLSPSSFEPSGDGKAESSVDSTEIAEDSSNKFGIVSFIEGDLASARKEFEDTQDPAVFDRAIQKARQVESDTVRSKAFLYLLQDQADLGLSQQAKEISDTELQEYDKVYALSYIAEKTSERGDDPSVLLDEAKAVANSVKDTREQSKLFDWISTKEANMGHFEKAKDTARRINLEDDGGQYRIYSLLDIAESEFKNGIDPKATIEEAVKAFDKLGGEEKNDPLFCRLLEVIHKSRRGEYSTKK